MGSSQRPRAAGAPHPVWVWGFPVRPVPLSTSGISEFTPRLPFLRWHLGPASSAGTSLSPPYLLLPRSRKVTPCPHLRADAGIRMAGRTSSDQFVIRESQPNPQLLPRVFPGRGKVINPPGAGRDGGALSQPGSPGSAIPSGKCRGIGGRRGWKRLAGPGGDELGGQRVWETL